MERETRDVRDAVREGYARIVRAPDASQPAAGAVPGGCCGTPAGGGGCCGSSAGGADAFALGLGYAPEDLAGLPSGTNLALSCGNPTALASLRPGEVVLDLGSGAGFDVLIAARSVGPEGRVIGVDMTPEMISRARENAAKVGATNVEFRLGEIENLPAGDGTVDVILSNCVVNLSPDKPRVFREIARVLRPGGRVAISDMALLRPLPEELARDLTAYVGCIAGAVPIAEYVEHVRSAGLADIAVRPKAGGTLMDSVQDPLYQEIQAKMPAGCDPNDYVVSVEVTAKKPA